MIMENCNFHAIFTLKNYCATRKPQTGRAKLKSDVLFIMHMRNLMVTFPKTAIFRNKKYLYLLYYFLNADSLHELGFR